MEKIDNICAIILAAGKGSRMGDTKQLLPLQGKPMLENIIEQVCTLPFAEIFIVIGHEAETIKQTILLEDKRCKWLYNPAYASGQSTSVQYALTTVIDVYQEAMIFLGDLPFVQEATMKQIYATGKASTLSQAEPYIVRPLYHHIAGHPVFIGKLHRDLLQYLKGDRGLRAIKHHFKYKKMIPVEDNGIILDIDTPQQYEQAMKRFT